MLNTFVSESAVATDAGGWWAVIIVVVVGLVFASTASGPQEGEAGRMSTWRGREGCEVEPQKNGGGCRDSHASVYTTHLFGD